MSQNAANAAKTALDQQKTLYNNMISTRDNALQQMANSFNYSNKQISDNYNDQVNKSMQDALSKIEALNKTGSLNTNE
jgi:phage tail tape-measure protein